MDPFQAALDAMFNGPGSIAALYQPAGSDDAPVRILLARPDATVTFRESNVVQATYEISVRRSEIPAPLAGDAFVIEDGEFPQISGVMTDTLRLAGDPMIDSEGLTWICGAEPA